MMEEMPVELRSASVVGGSGSGSEMKIVQHLVELVKQLIKEQQYDGVALLFTSANEAARNKSALEKGAAIELLHEVCLPQLNAANYEDKPLLYGCVEELLKVIAAHAPAEELLLELLEMVEEQKSEYVFNSALRALQVVLLRLGKQKPRALEWSLASVQTHLSELPMPRFLSEGYDLKQSRLLEQDEQVQSFLMHYITIGLFYDPILKDIQVENSPLDKQGPLFRELSVSRRNVLACFLIKLLGKPFGLLDLCLTNEEESKYNTYTAQCARQMTKDINSCIGNPFYFLSLAESRIRWRRRLDPSKEVYEQSSSIVFMHEEKLPIHALALYFYMVFVEEVDLDTTVPKVYAPSYVFEAGLYLATVLLEQEEPALHLRGLLMAEKLLELMNNREIPAVSLELNVHTRFCQALCNIVAYSAQTHLRQMGVHHLRLYILAFDDKGKYLVLKNLMRTISHTGIAGYLAIIYKDLVAQALRKSNSSSANSPTLPSSFSGHEFRSIFLHQICRLPQGAETDLVDHADKVISSLNAIRFFAINDCDNRTGFWDFFGDLERDFLTPLRQGLDLSIAHYNAESVRIEKGIDNDDHKKAVDLLDISVVNGTPETETENYSSLDREQKLGIINKHLCTFDLMRSLLGRLTECVENSSKFVATNRINKSIVTC